LATFTTPFSVIPLAMRSREFVMLVRSSVPLSVTPSRTLLALAIAANDPAPLVLMTPEMRTPFCRTVLPASATIWLPRLPKTSEDSTSVAPFSALRMPLLVIVPPGGCRFNVAPDTSAVIRPLFTRLCAPPTVMALLMAPWPRMVRPEARVVTPLPSSVMRAPASFRLMTPVPPMVWSPPGVSELSKLRMPPLPTLMVLPDVSVRPLAMRSRELAMVVRFSVPLSVTPSRMLLALLVAANVPAPLVLMTPDMRTPFCRTVLPAPATI
jgi:hypothetical protein